MANTDNLIPVNSIQGTSGRIFTGIKYALLSRSSKKYLDAGDENGTKAVVTAGDPKENFYLNWFLYPIDSKFVAIRSVPRKCYLDGRSSSGDNIVLTWNRDPKSDGEGFLLWSLQPVNEFYALNRKISNKYIDGRRLDGANNIIVVNRNPVGDPHLHWSFVPINYNFISNIMNFKYAKKYEDLSAFAKTSNSKVLWEMENESNDIPYDANPSFSGSLENYNSWSFKESEERTFVEGVERGLEVGIEAKFLSSSASLKNTHQWTSANTSITETATSKMDTTTISVSTSITIPPRTKVSYFIAWKYFDVYIDFNATVHITGFSDRIDEDGGLKPGIKVPPECAIALMHVAGYNGEIIGVVGDEVLLRIRGTNHVTGAITGKVVVNSVKI